MSTDDSSADPVAWEKIPGPTHLDPDPGFDIPDEVYSAKTEANTRDSARHLLETFQEFLDGYLHWGGYRYHGFTAQEDPENFRGAAILSEADIVLRLAPLLSSRFPETSEVHAEFNIANWTRADYNKEEDRTSGST